MLPCCSLRGLSRTFSRALPRVMVGDGPVSGPRGHGEELVPRDGLGIVRLESNHPASQFAVCVLVCSSRQGGSDTCTRMSA